MSIARFHPEYSDVYVYEDWRGLFVTHVAANRVVPIRPFPKVEPPNGTDKDKIQKWVEKEVEVTRITAESPRKSIDLPHAGDSFDDATAAECRDRLLELKKLGYRVPQFALDCLVEDPE